MFERKGSIEVGRRRLLRGTAMFAAGFAMAAALVGATGAPAWSASLAEIKQRGYMTVATEDDFRPFEFMKDGKPTGFDNELLEKLRKVSPVEIRQEMIPWTGLLAGVSTGKYDLALTAALMTKERQQSLDFTMPIAEATDYYMKRKGDKKIQTIKDLSGRPLGVQAGSAMLAQLPQLEDMLAKLGGKMGQVIQYTSYPEAYQDLAIGRTDYVVNTVINLQTVVQEKPNVFELGEPVSEKTYIGWAVKKGNTDLVDFLNKFLAQERENGEMSALQKKWFGQSFDDMPTSWEAKS
jgi:polar amino acid transport system substrate-binding protein